MIAPQFITNANGDKTAVILTLADYQELLDDLDDLAAIAELRDEESIPWEQVKQDLVANASRSKKRQERRCWPCLPLRSKTSPA